MDPRFFRSREFFAGLAVGLLVIAGVAVAAVSIDGIAFGGGNRCRVAAPEGAPVQVTPEDTGLTRDGLRAARTLTYTFASDADATRIAACTGTGSLRAVPGEDGVVRVVFTVTSLSAKAVEATRVEAIVAQEGDELRIAAQVPSQPRVREGFQTTGASVAVTLHLPPDLLHSLDLRAHTGHVDAHDLRVSEATLRAGVGHVRATNLQLEGDLRAASDVGDVRLALDSARSGLVRATTDVGGVDVRLPSRADIGYAVIARADVGRITLELGETDTLERSREGAGERAAARTAGYADKPTQVRVETSTNVGDIGVRVEVEA